MYPLITTPPNTTKTANLYDASSVITDLRTWKRVPKVENRLVIQLLTKSTHRLWIQFKAPLSSKAYQNLKHPLELSEKLRSFPAKFHWTVSLLVYFSLQLISSKCSALTVKEQFLKRFFGVQSVLCSRCVYQHYKSKGRCLFTA